MWKQMNTIEAALDWKSSVIYSVEIICSLELYFSHLWNKEIWLDNLWGSLNRLTHGCEYSFHI